MSPDETPAPLMDTKTRTLFVSLAVLSFVGLSATLLFGRKAQGLVPTQRDSYSDGPIGHKAFVQIMDGLDVRVTRRQVAGSGEARPTWFIEPAALEVSTPDGTSKLAQVLKARWEENKQSVLVLPKWQIDPEGLAVPTGMDRIRELLDALPSLDAQHAPIARLGLPHESSTNHSIETESGIFAIDVPWLQTASFTDGWVPVASLAQSDQALILQSEDARLTIITDPDLLHNFNIHRADHAELLRSVTIPNSSDGWLGTESHLVVDEVFHGHAHSLSLRDALSTWPRVLFPLHALLLALLWVMRGLRRFGSPAPRARSTRVHDEGVAAAARALVTGHSEGVLLRRYIAAVFAEIAHRHGLHAATDAARACEIDAFRQKRGLPPHAEALWEKVQTLTTPSRLGTHEVRALLHSARLLQAPPQGNS